MPALVGTGFNARDIAAIDRELQDLATKDTRTIESAGLRSAAELAKDDVVARTPVDTGRLRASIVRKNRRVVAPFPASLVEFGTVRAPAQPFFFNTVVNGGRRQLQAFATGAGRSLRRLVKRRARAAKPPSVLH